MHLGPRPNVVITTAEAFEKILNSNQHITKVSSRQSLRKVFFPREEITAGWGQAFSQALELNVILGERC